MAPVMSTVATILTLSDRYCEALEIAPSTLSTRVFNDGKIIGRLRDGGDITTGRAAAAIEWFRVNWPEKVEWPSASLSEAAQ